MSFSAKFPSDEVSFQVLARSPGWCWPWSLRCPRVCRQRPGREESYQKRRPSASPKVPRRPQRLGAGWAGAPPNAKETYSSGFPSEKGEGYGIRIFFFCGINLVEVNKFGILNELKHAHWSYMKQKQWGYYAIPTYKERDINQRKWGGLGFTLKWC